MVTSTGFNVPNSLFLESTSSIFTFFTPFFYLLLPISALGVTCFTFYCLLFSGIFALVFYL
jgi:hypothetical protein